MQGLGYLPDVDDPRDYRFGSAPIGEPGDLRPWIERLPEQGASNTCVLNAIALALAIADARRGRPFRFVSRLYGYYYARRRAQARGELADLGCRPRDALYALRKLGSPDESVWRFDLANVNRRPPFAAVRLAIDRPFAYVRANMLDEMRASLSAGRAVVVGFRVDRAFLDALGPPTIEGFDPESIVGGHMVTAIADEPDHPGGPCLVLANSYGPGWRDRGFFRMPYDAIEREAVDGWAVS